MIVAKATTAGGVFTTPAHGTFSPPVVAFSCRVGNSVVRTLFQMKIDFLNDEFSFLVFLAGLVRFTVRPSYHAIAPLTKNITDDMEAGHEATFFLGAGDNVHTLIQ